MPIIDGLEDTGLWGAPSVLPRDKDNGVEDNQWCYWGGNPVLGADGKYHIAVCRWPESTGHHGWFESEVAHCVSDNPIGPYRVTQTIVKKGHNPEVLRLPNGRFALHVLNGNNVYEADKMQGPWSRVGTIRISSRGFRPTDRVGSNLTTEFRPDGSVIVMKKDGDVAISRSGVVGPYQMVSANNYARATGYPEDPVVWRSRHQYHAIYNHAQDRKSAYMRSLDGVHWRHETGLPYDASTTFYENGVSNQWYKIERPKVLQDALGRATHLSLAVMDVSKGADKGNDNHSSKNLILPLVTEKLVSLVGGSPVTAATKTITLRIQGEAGFDPRAEMDLESLRLGSDSLVNYGGGCQAIGAEPDGRDLLVTFEGRHGARGRDYDFKLLGETKTGDLVFGYALLPGKSATAAALITLPARVEAGDGGAVLQSTLENWGLEPSGETTAVVLRDSGEGEEPVARTSCPSIEPYGSAPISIPLPASTGAGDEYRVVLARSSSLGEYWRRVDDTHASVEFDGEWARHDKPNADYYRGNERVSSTLGDEVTFSFEGVRARVYGLIGRGMGSYAVYVDGQYAETFRCNWAPVSRARLYQTELLSDGPHTLRLVKTKTDLNGEVSIDFFSYESEANAPAAPRSLGP
ncbi:MAG: glycoside hydrolase family protein [Planctomycetota bacterium]